MSSTTNSITVEEPNPTGASVPFNVEVGVRYPTTVAAATTPSESDALLYGPASDAFCGVPTITSISPDIWFAGQSYNITITGTGFNPTASQSCAQSNVMVSMANGGTVSTTVTAITPTQITATVTPATTDSTSGATVAIIGAPTQAPNADVLEVPVITWASDPDGTSPTISGPNAKLPNPSAVVGQQILLTTTPTAATLATLPVQVTLAPAAPPTVPVPWTAGGTNVGGYSPSASGAAVADTTLTNPTLTTYWVYPAASIPVSYQYCVSTGSSNLCSDPTTATFNVQGPTGDLLISAKMPTDGSGVQIYNSANGSVLGTQGVLVNSGQEQVGITFTSDATPVAGYNKSFTFVQLLSGVQRQYVNSNGPFATPTPPESGLDGTYPYSYVSPTETWDSPSAGLPSIYGEGWETFTATMYLMWDPALPSGCSPAKTVQNQNGTFTSTPSTCNESIPVPLSSVTWHWSGCAINALTNQSNGTTWIQSTLGGCPVQALGTPQKAWFPTW